MEPELEEMISWARQAGSILRDGYGRQHHVDHKGRVDLVTEMDHRSEAYLLEQIRAHYPEHSVETEESGFLPGAARARWYIDPLDGTTNYAHAIPFFCVSLAFARDNELELGVVYEPMRDECFSAQRGKGAWLNGAPLHVSQTRDMLHSLLVTGFPYEPHSLQESNLPAFVHFTPLSQGVRRLGAAALDLCFVAAGRFEGYWEQTLQPYDFAAGALIVQEAGGIITSLDGQPDLFRPPYAILAGNPAVHAQMLAEFQKIDAASAAAGN